MINNSTGPKDPGAKVHGFPKIPSFRSSFQVKGAALSPASEALADGAKTESGGKCTADATPREPQRLRHLHIAAAVRLQGDGILTRVPLSLPGSSTFVG